MSHGDPGHVRDLDRVPSFSGSSDYPAVCRTFSWVSSSRHAVRDSSVCSAPNPLAADEGLPVRFSHRYPVNPTETCKKRSCNTNRRGQRKNLSSISLSLSIEHGNIKHTGSLLIVVVAKHAKHVCYDIVSRYH